VLVSLFHVEGCGSVRFWLWVAANIQSQVFLKLVSAQLNYIIFLFIVINNFLHAGSHDFQNITMSSSRRGEISVTGDFIPDSSAIGILIVAYSADSDTNIDYNFIHRSSIHTTTSMSSLPSGQYEVSVFVMEGNGLPFNKSATAPRNVSLVEGSLHDLIIHNYGHCNYGI
jgi:hypothetical protein